VSILMVSKHIINPTNTLPNNEKKIKTAYSGRITG
jgi:hypothetical protein